MDLPLFYFLVLGFCIFMYVCLDGFDLGIGILYPWFDKPGERDHLMLSISHVWDGNETWLVMGGALLYGIFPAAYAGLLSILYIPLMLMLFSLIFRGVAFEYRFKSDRSRPYWDFAFSAGSAVAAFCQGLVLGTVVQGIPVGSEAISSLHWITPFTIFTGFAVMAGYAMLGACYLFMKSRGVIQAHAAKLAKVLLVLVMIAMAVVSIWTVLTQPDIKLRWFSGSHFLYLAPLPILCLIAAIVSWKDLHSHRHESRPFWCGVLLFLLGLAGLVVSVFPYLIPRQLTLWEAASPTTSLLFLLPGVCIFIPVICIYTLWGYRVFAGKVEDYQEGY
ncbi:cytochrome d ubiquinol oxidase subunit II [Marinomonas sp. TI.3.20]|uniref:cytochrome d ubiquinol oxidase subunit II n=1 Tax=Marinomonas sp. TI.3.20 TaxID=3121296 RepID=UPI00311F5998